MAPRLEGLDDVHAAAAARAISNDRGLAMSLFAFVIRLG